jgi:hypothetical protein
MKSFTFKRSRIPHFLLTLFSFGSLGSLPAQGQTATITSPASGTAVFTGASVAISASRSSGASFGGTGNFNFTFSSTPSAGVSFSTNPVNTGATTAATNAVFSGSGSYSVQVEVERSNGTGVQNTLSPAITLNAFNANLWAANGGAQITQYSVAATTLNAGPGNVFDPYPNGDSTTAALGKDAPGNFYFMTNNNAGSQNGNVTLYATSPSGSNITVVATADLNGTSNNELGFVRLGIDQTGTGWILAGDGTTLLLASFPANGTATTSITIVDPSVSISGGGAIADFVNGDLAFSGDSGIGTMFALANDGSGVTTLYTMTPSGTSSTLVRKFGLVNNTNDPFTGQVNGVAFDAAGALYISCSGADAGLYYINPSTVTSPPNPTVQCTIVQPGGSLTDLASNVWPSTALLPVKLGSFTVKRSGSNAALDWITLNEKNNDRFEIERSEDGVNFVSVGSVPGAGTTNDVQTYQFTDPIGTVTAKNLYYRLKNADIDGKVYYSKIVMLRLNGGPVKDLTVFPNPFTSDLKLVVQSRKETAITIGIRNAVGQQVMRKTINVQPGENIIVFSDLEALKPGLHLMEILSEGETMTQKIIKK